MLGWTAEGGCPHTVQITLPPEQERQENTPQPQLAAGAIEPLLQSVSAAAGTAAADSNGFASQRKRDVGVGRGALDLRGVAQVGIHGANHLQDARAGVEFSRRAVADGDDFVVSPEKRR